MPASLFLMRVHKQQKKKSELQRPVWVPGIHYSPLFVDRLFIFDAGPQSQPRKSLVNHRGCSVYAELIIVP